MNLPWPSFWQHVREDVPAQPPGLTLSDLGKWCASEGIPQAEADRARVACGLGAYDWKALETQRGALELIQGRLMQWQQEAEEAPELEEEFAPAADAGAALQARRRWSLRLLHLHQPRWKT